jgi:PAS domain S-box-containing protein
MLNELETNRKAPGEEASLNKTLDGYLQQQDEAVLLIPLNGRAAYLNDLCRELFNSSPKGIIWFALHCAISEQLIGEVPYLRVGLDRSEQHSRTLSERVIEAREGEQGRLSREVHDGVLQCIIGARMLLERVLAGVPRDTPEFRTLLDVEECLVQANDEGRKLLKELRPATIDELGLVDALKLFLERMQREYGTQFELDNQCEPGTRFPPEVRSNLYRVLQEGIHNAVKHSGSNRVQVSLGQVGNEAWVRVEDWGVGFDLQKSSERQSSEHVGLSSFRERASLLGGRCEISSQPNEGTTIEVRVPLETALESGFSNLRSRAQAILQRRPSDHGEEALVAELGPDEVAALLHEFEVHRMELEIQNNELRLAQAELVSSRDRFRALYEHTAFGYLEIDSTGRIKSTNLTFSSMLGRPRYDLIGRALDSLLDPDFQGQSGATGSREVKMFCKADPGWFWAKLKSRPVAGRRSQVRVEDLTSHNIKAKQQAQVGLHIDLAKRKETLARRKDEIFSNLLVSLGEICEKASLLISRTPVELVKEMEASLGQALSQGHQSFIAPSSTTNPAFKVDTCLSDTLSALSLTRDLDRLDCFLDAGQAELVGDPLLFGILVEKLIFPAIASVEIGQGRVTLTTGFLQIGEKKSCFLEVADTGTEGDKNSAITTSSQLKHLADSFGGSVSSLYEPGRGSTVRVLFPLNDVDAQ